MSNSGSKKAKRRIIFITLTITFLLVVLISTSFKTWMQIIDNKKEISSLKGEYKTLLEEQESLNSEVVKLKDPEYVARYAREKFLFSLPGEIIIRHKEVDKND